MSANLLRNKLRTYRNKFHRVQLIHGLILWIAISALSLFALGLLEYVSYWSSVVKTTVLIIWILSALVLLLFWVIRPMAALLWQWGAMSDRDAARRIGQSFPEVEDRLLNLLELEADSAIDSAYLADVIEQRSRALSGVRFDTGITWRRVRQAAAAFGLPMALLFIFGLFDSGNRLFEGSNRLLNYRTAFVPQAPFEFLPNGPWRIEKGNSLRLELRVEGKEVPRRAEVLIGNTAYPMQREASGVFFWTIDRVEESAVVRFRAMDFLSEQYEMEILPVPALRTFQMEIIPPTYTGLASDVVTGSGDGVVPVGSRVQWTMLWESADEVHIHLNDSSLAMSRTNQEWHRSDQLLKGGVYYFVGSNKTGTSFESGNYEIELLPDLPPELDGEISVDTIAGRVYISGSSSDDYGIRKVEVLLVKRDDQERIEVARRPGLWSYSFDLVEKKVEVSVIAWDNDGVSGSKSTVLGPWTLSPQSRSELRDRAERQEQERLEHMSDLRREQEKARRNQRELERQLLDGNPKWKMEQSLNQMREQQRSMLDEWQKMMEAARRENRQRMLENPENQENQERREKLEQLMEDMDRDRLEELLRELEELRDPDEEEIRNWMREMQRENRQMERDLERLEELMKRLRFEQDLERRLEELSEMQERQEELAGEEGESREEQDALNENFEAWKERMEELEQSNEELKRPNEFDHDEELSDETSESMEQSSEELEQNDQQKANEQQQKSSDQMQKMKQQMQQSMMSMEMEMHMENLEHLRRILTNLLHLSYEQEGLSQSAQGRSHTASDRAVVEWMRNQQRIRSNYQLVDDSLTALISRIPEIEAPVTRWMEEAATKMEAANEALSERQLPMSTSRMRESMTALNELSLILDVTMDQIQAMMSAMMEGDQICDKPGGGKPSMGNMLRLQQQLNSEAEEMGKNPGKGQPGGEGEPGREDQGGMSQEIAEMMARQEQIRRMLEESMGSSGDSGQKDLLEKMKDQERDLARRNFDAEFFERQREIEVKMLELESAERVQEQKEERESENLTRYQELRRQREEEFLRGQMNRREELRYEVPALMPFYRDISRLYLRE